MLEGSVDEDGFDEVSQDRQPEDEAEAFLDSLVAEESLAGDRAWPPAEQREAVQRSFGDAVAFLLRSAFVDAVDNESCQTHHSEPDGADDDRSLTHFDALLILDVDSFGAGLLRKGNRRTVWLVSSPEDLPG